MNTYCCINTSVYATSALQVNLHTWIWYVLKCIISEKWRSRYFMLNGILILYSCRPIKLCMTLSYNLLTKVYKWLFLHHNEFRDVEKYDMYLYRIWWRKGLIDSLNCLILSSYDGYQVWTLKRLLFFHLRQKSMNKIAKDATKITLRCLKCIIKLHHHSIWNIKY